MSRQFWEEAISWVVSDGSAIANSTTEQILFPNVTIPGNYMQDGRCLRLTAFGRYSTTGTPTMTFRVRWNGAAGTTLAASGAMVSGSGVTAAEWMVQVYLQTRSNGASGTIFAMGSAILGAGATSTVGSATSAQAGDLMGSAGVTTPAVSSAIDLTADTPLALTIQWGTANASNTITGHLYVIESLN